MVSTERMELSFEVRITSVSLFFFFLLVHRTSNVFSQQEVRDLNASQKKITEQLKSLSETMFGTGAGLNLDLE